MAFDAVAHHGTTHQADHGGQGAAVAVTDRVAHGTTGDAADHRASTRLAPGHHDGLVAADFAWHGDALDHGGAAEHTGPFLLFRPGLGQTAGAHADQGGKDGDQDGLVQRLHGELLC
ncbi:hypothetical protein D9M69_710680 [compost metagenome]